jgi:hypothetical protein
MRRYCTAALGVLLGLAIEALAQDLGVTQVPGSPVPGLTTPAPAGPMGVPLPGYLQTPGQPFYTPALPPPPAAVAPAQTLQGTPIDAPFNWGTVGASGQNEPRSGIMLFNDVDSWRGVGDRANAFTRQTNNEGGSFGFNYATRLGGFSDLTGIGFQVGASYGLYDLNGRPFNADVLDTVHAQQQFFFTTGFFKKADQNSSWSYGFVHDWMFNQAWGAFAVNPTLGQWRMQLAYAVDSENEFGVWVALRDKGSTNLDFFGNTVATRPIDQGNLFWHHKWELGADSWIWIGLPENDRLNTFQGGSLGNLLIGGSTIAPLNDAVALYANWQYMHPSASPGPPASGEASWYVAFGLQFYIGGRARTDTVSGNRWMPLLPVANNGNFLVDAAHF